MVLVVEELNTKYPLAQVTDIQDTKVKEPAKVIFLLAPPQKAHVGIPVKGFAHVAVLQVPSTSIVTV